MLGEHIYNLGTVLKHVIYNELSTTRNPNNMSLLGMIQYKPEAVSKVQEQSTINIELNYITSSQNDKS
jgi:integrator complex subunit 1